MLNISKGPIMDEYAAKLLDVRAAAVLYHPTRKLSAKEIKMTAARTASAEEKTAITAHQQFFEYLKSSKVLASMLKLACTRCVDRTSDPKKHGKPLLISGSKEDMASRLVYRAQLTSIGEFNNIIRQQAPLLGFSSYYFDMMILMLMIMMMMMMVMMMMVMMMNDDDDNDDDDE